MLVSSILYDTMYDHSSVGRSVVDALVLDAVPKASVARSEDDASPVTQSIESSIYGTQHTSQYRCDHSYQNTEKKINRNNRQRVSGLITSTLTAQTSMPYSTRLSQLIYSYHHRFQLCSEENCSTGRSSAVNHIQP